MIYMNFHANACPTAILPCFIDGRNMQREKICFNPENYINSILNGAVVKICESSDPVCINLHPHTVIPILTAL